MASDVSIVLVNWNGLRFTAQALESLREKVRGVTFEAIVVDNASTRDASATELPARFPWVRFIANAENVGFSRANNQALREATGRFFLLLNNDTIQTEDAVTAAVRYLEANPDVDVLGIEHRNADGSHQDSAFDFPTPWREVASLLGFPSRRRPPPPGDVDWIVGSFLLVRRETWRAVGELDERFFLYAEDVDWCLRARRAGKNVRYWSGASMVHLGSAARPYMKDKTFIHFRSQLSYYRKNHSLVAATAYYLAMSLRLAGAFSWAALRLAPGDARERLGRLRDFVLLRPGNLGVPR